MALKPRSGPEAAVKGNGAAGADTVVRRAPRSGPRVADKKIGAAGADTGRIRQFGARRALKPPGTLGPRSDPAVADEESAPLPVSSIL